MATPSQPPTNPSELQLYRVLQRANLLQYYDTFISQGGDDVDQLCEAGEDEFLEIMALVGMASKPLHVRRLQKALQAWVVNPASFEGNVRKIFPTHVHSMTGSTQSLGHASQSLTSPTHTPVADRPVVSSAQQQDYKITPPQSSTISTSTPWSTTLVTGHEIGSPSEHSGREQPSPTGSQEEEFKDMLFGSDSGASFSGNLLAGAPLGQPLLLEHQITAIASAAALLAQELPPIEPKSLPKKQISKEINMVMSMAQDDPVKMDALRKYAAIYGRFDSKRKNDRPMSLHEISVNEAAAQLCSHLPALLTRREELFPLARQVVRDSGYQYSKGHSRAAEIIPTKMEPPSDDPDGVMTPSSIDAGTSSPASPLEDRLVKTQNDLTDVTSNLTELSKEQERIRSALRVLLEAKDHTQMSALTAEMDTINDRYARLTARRQELVGLMASLRRQSPKLSTSGAGTDDQAIAEEKQNALTGVPIDVIKSPPNSLNTLYVAAALHNTNEDSLIEEGLRIATQYGMSDFAQELIGMKYSQQPTAEPNTANGGKKARDTKATNPDTNPNTTTKRFEQSVLDKTKTITTTPSKDCDIQTSGDGQTKVGAVVALPTSTSLPCSQPSHSGITTITTITNPPTTINIVSGVGFQQYVSSPTTTTQKLRSLDSLNITKTATDIPVVFAKDLNTTPQPRKRAAPSASHLATKVFASQSVPASSPDSKDTIINNNNNDFITLAIPTNDSSTSYTVNKQTEEDSQNISISNATTITPTTTPNNITPSPTHNSNPPTTPPTKPVETELTRRSSRKRTTDPDYYVINGGGEKRARPRRSSSTSSERNAKLTTGLGVTSMIMSNTSSTPSPSSAYSSPAPSPLVKSSVGTGQPPSPVKGNNSSLVVGVNVGVTSGVDVNHNTAANLNESENNNNSDSNNIVRDTVTAEERCGNDDDDDDDVVIVVTTAGSNGSSTTTSSNSSRALGVSGSGKLKGVVGEWVSEGDDVKVSIVEQPAASSSSLLSPLPGVGGGGGVDSPQSAGLEEDGNGSVLESGTEGGGGGDRRGGRRKRNQQVVSYAAFR